ncbi:hypothetical protein TEA_024078 [Camellia sinensis var. sinensis]|uniref:Uncharacterized protein n=1 Tax=Camellia sinensis var. sinensis TaxID=542762 RepID=A0A4S4DMA8_CAMSN|nr:hypothetical protein TEA_024078 [Camellia sinensis var. sinensis]
MGTEEPKGQLKGMDWENIGDSIHNEPSAGPVTKKRLPRKVRQIPDCYFLPRRSLPSAIAFYGAWIVAGVGAGMLAEIWINKKVKASNNIDEFEDLTPVANSDSQYHLASPSNQGSSFASIGNLQSLNSIEDSLPRNFDQVFVPLFRFLLPSHQTQICVDFYGFVYLCSSCFAILLRSEIAYLTLVAISDSQHHSANPSNRGSLFASIGNLQSLNSIEDSLPENFDQEGFDICTCFYQCVREVLPRKFDKMDQLTTEKDGIG